MRALVVLTAVFSLLTAYLECGTTQAYAPPVHAAAKVVRNQRPDTAQPADATPAVATADSGQSPAPAPQTSGPLNLQVPSLETIQQSLDTGKSRLMDLFDRRNPNRISYDAELVYDAEKGEDITGGKVNIKIPLS